MSPTTSEATVARKLGGGPRVAGVGPAEQDTVVRDATSAIDGRGGCVRLYGAAGTHAVGNAQPNTVALIVKDAVGAAHVLRGVFRVGPNTYSTATFGGTVGDFIELIGAEGCWDVSSNGGVTLS